MNNYKTDVKTALNDFWEQIVQVIEDYTIIALGCRSRGEELPVLCVNGFKPKSNCQHCYGRGHVGRMTTGSYLLCRCVYKQLVKDFAEQIQRRAILFRKF